MGEVIKKTSKGRFIGWYLRYVDADGCRKQRASGQPSFADAKKMLAQVEARIALGQMGMAEQSGDALPDNETLTLAGLIERFVTSGSRPRIKDVASYRKRVGFSLARVLSAAPQIAKLRAAELTPKHIAKIRETLCERHPNGTVRNSLTALSAALSWAVSEELLHRNPVRGVEPPLPPPSRLEFLSVDEVRQLLGEAERQARAAKTAMPWSRFIAVSLALRLGLRRGELFGLRWSDVDLATGRITVARSYRSTPKSGKPRHLRIPDALAGELRAWQSRCPATPEQLVCPALFHGGWGMYRNTGSSRSLNKLYKAAGIRELDRPWHLLRHTFASHFVQSGGSLLALSQILGHSDVKTTMIYAHLSPEFMAEQVNRVKY